MAPIEIWLAPFMFVALGAVFIWLALVLLAEYRIKHGNISFDTAMDLVSREDFDEVQAKQLGEGLEIIVGMLGFIEQGRRPQ